jgi:hypothetical protein
MSVTGCVDTGFLTPLTIKDISEFTGTAVAKMLLRVRVCEPLSKVQGSVVEEIRGAPLMARQTTLVGLAK